MRPAPRPRPSTRNSSGIGWVVALIVVSVALLGVLSVVTVMFGFLGGFAAALADTGY
jgi:hypothetical protein